MTRQKMDKNKKLDLYIKQKNTLDIFLEKGAISKAQHDYSLCCLREKMGVTDDEQAVKDDINQPTSTK